jgi:hypothetical protein
MRNYAGVPLPCGVIRSLGARLEVARQQVNGGGAGEADRGETAPAQVVQTPGGDNLAPTPNPNGASVRTAVPLGLIFLL